jgi:hypothetical protein
MQHHHVEWVNQLCYTISTAVFNGYVCYITRGYPLCRWNFNGKISVRLRIQSLIMTMEDGFNAPGRKTGGTWWIEWAIKITNIHP